MAVPVASLPAHGRKRKSRDEEEEDVPAEGSNKRRISAGRTVEKREPRRSLRAALPKASQPSTKATAAAANPVSGHDHIQDPPSADTSRAPAQEAVGRAKPTLQPTHKMLLDRLYGGIKQADEGKVPANRDIATSKLSKKASAKLASRHEGTKLTRERKVLQQFVQDNQTLVGEPHGRPSNTTTEHCAGPVAAMTNPRFETGLFDPQVPSAADLAKPERARTQSHRIPKPSVEQDEQLRDKIYQDETVRQLVQGAQQMLDPQYERIAVSDLLNHRRPVVPLQDCVDDAATILRHVQAEEEALATIVHHSQTPREESYERTNNGEVFNQDPRNRTKAQKDQLLASHLEVPRKPEDGDRVPSRKVSKDLLTGRIPYVLIEAANKKLQRTDPDLCNDQAVFLAAQWQIENLQGTINDLDLAQQENVINAQERMLEQHNDTIERLLDEANVRDAEIKARNVQIEQLRTQLKEQERGSELTPPLSTHGAEEQDEIS